MRHVNLSRLAGAEQEALGSAHRENPAFLGSLYSLLISERLELRKQAGM